MEETVTDNGVHIYRIQYKKKSLWGKIGNLIRVLGI